MSKQRIYTFHNHTGYGIPPEGSLKPSRIEEKTADIINQLNGKIPKAVRERDEINNFTRIEEK